MNNALKIKREFLEALKERDLTYGRGFQTFLATSIGKTKGALTSVFKYFKSEIDFEKVKLSFEMQIEIAEACECDYLDFVQRGRFLLYGESQGEEKPDRVSQISSKTEKHIKIIKEFKNKERALDANIKLLKIEAGDQFEYGRILERIDTIAKEIDSASLQKTGTNGGNH